MGTLSKKKRKKYEEAGYDLSFVQRVQPHGNVDMTKSKYYTTGDGIYTILTVYDYPTEGLGFAWLKKLCQRDYVRSFLSIKTANNVELMKELEKSIGETESQVSGKEKTTTNARNVDQIYDMTQLFRAISNQNIPMKSIWISLFIFAPTKEKLEERQQDIFDHCSQFKMVVLQDELHLEYQAPWIDPENRELLGNQRKGTPITVKDLAGGFFFEHTKLEDEAGSYFGYTRTRGAINFDFFKQTNRRTRPLMFVSGNPNMGQETFVMNVMDDLFAKGHFIRTINADTTGRYNQLTRLQQGIILDLAGTENRINPFQIFPTATKDDGVTIDEVQSFSLHIEKLKNMLSMLNGDITADDLQVFEQLLTRFYIDWNMWFVNPQEHEGELRATKINNEEYPILRDFLQWLDTEKRNNREPFYTTSLNRIYMTFTSLLSTKGDMFNGVTEFQDVSQEQVVTYDVSKLLGQQGIFNAQVFSVLSLLSADILNHAKKNRALVKQQPEMKDTLKYYAVNFNNAENIIHRNFPMGVELMVQMVEKMSENYAGVIIGVKSLQGILFERGAGSGYDPFVVAVKKLFGIMQYRIFAQTSETDIPLLADALAGSLSESEIGYLPNLAKEQLFFNITGETNLVFTQQLFEQQLERYGGWA